MCDKDYTDEIFDSLLSVALKQQMSQEIPDLPTDEELETLVKPIPKLDRKIRRQIKGHYFKKRLKKLSVHVSRAAVMIGIFLMLSVVIIVNVDASRLQNVVNEIHERFIRRSPYPAFADEIYWQAPAYIPSGFEIVDRFKRGHEYWTVFGNDCGDEILLAQSRTNDILTLYEDNEFTEMLEIELFYNEAFLFESDRPTPHLRVHFQKDGFAFWVKSTIDFADTLNLILSLI